MYKETSGSMKRFWPRRCEPRLNSDRITNAKAALRLRNSRYSEHLIVFNADISSI